MKNPKSRQGTTGESPDKRLFSPQFPRSNQYNPTWVMATCFGAHSLWLTEWLTERIPLRSGMRVLDLGCGCATSSIFLAREFDVQVWAVDLWVPATENHIRVGNYFLQDQIIPLHCDARSLPFPANYFDAVIAVDSFNYFGTDSLYLNYLANFVRQDGYIGIVGAGLVRDLDPALPRHLKAHWPQDHWSLRTAEWWRTLWERTGIVSIEVSDTMPNGGAHWLQWQKTAHPENTAEIEQLTADDGENLTYVRQVGRKLPGVQLSEYCFPDPLKALIPGTTVRHMLFRRKDSDGNDCLNQVKPS